MEAHAPTKAQKFGMIGTIRLNLNGRRQDKRHGSDTVDYRILHV